MRLKKAIVAALLLSPLYAGAQTMKPGLWQISSKTQMEGAAAQEMARAQEQLANLPPEQRKMMEAIMARQGMSFGKKEGAGTVDTKVCVSKEMAVRKEVPTEREGCQQSVSATSGGKMKIKFICANPPSRGEGQIVFSSPKAYTMSMTTRSTANGRDQEVNMSANGKWLSVDCGDIKPGGGAR